MPSEIVISRLIGGGRLAPDASRRPELAVKLAFHVALAIAVAAGTAASPDACGRVQSAAERLARYGRAAKSDAAAGRPPDAIAAARRWRARASDHPGRPRTRLVQDARVHGKSAVQGQAAGRARARTRRPGRRRRTRSGWLLDTGHQIGTRRNNRPCGGLAGQLTDAGFRAAVDRAGRGPPCCCPCGRVSAPEAGGRLMGGRGAPGVGIGRGAPGTAGAAPCPVALPHRARAGGAGLK